MRSIRWMLMLAVVVVGVAAEAQCLKCYTQPPRWRQGTCGESFDGYRDRNCGYEGQSCSIPDFSDPCDPWLMAGAAPLDTESPRSYFTTRLPVEARSESLHRRLQRLDPSAPRCRAKALA